MKMSMTRSASPMTPFTAWLPMCSQQARNERMTWPPDLRRGWCLLMARRKIRKPRSEATRCREMDVNGERLPSVNFSRPKRSSTSIRPEGAHFCKGGGRARLQDRQPGADLRVARMPRRGRGSEEPDQGLDGADQGARAAGARGHRASRYCLSRSLWRGFKKEHG